MREPKDSDSVTEIRLAFAGAKNSGKSALAVRFLTKRFIGEYASHKDVTVVRTIGIADKVVKLSLRDTTGTEWMNSVSNTVNWASAIIVVYSIIDRGSFLVASSILENIHKQKPLHSSCTLLLGNKSDLKHYREVKKCEAKRLAMDYGVRFRECSASESYDEIHSSITALLLEALLVHNGKRLSGEITDDEKTGKTKDVRQRRRSSSQPQNFYIPSCQQKEKGNTDEKKEILSTVKSYEPIQFASPAERRREHTPREMPRNQRKQSLRRKISGIGSRIVGSQNGNR